ncbi:MAG: methane monooxygenase/ammonia monooxygenase subunit C [Gammaproteobacteria bacterium]|nr:methane monooxygenase/ammonia monooxygenase subunit C [Gammaproteobacteria bacterium]
MAIVIDSSGNETQSDPSTSLTEEEPIPTVPWGQSSIAIGAALVLFIAYRMYMNKYSFTVGMDYFDPEFQTYWMRLFWAQLAIIGLIGAIGIPLLWKTRDINVADISPKLELTRYYTMFSLMALASIVAFVALALFGEADAAWHQVTIRDTDFTPTHIGLFYFAMPLMWVGLALAFIWIHTRLPDFQNRISIPFALLAAGPLLIAPNLGFNEWGHAFFYAEELFGSPVHYGFFFLGFGFFAFGGFLVQCFNRMSKLTYLDDDEDPIVMTQQ